MFCDDGDWGGRRYHCGICDDEESSSVSQKITEEHLDATKHRCNKHLGTLSSPEMLYALERLQNDNFKITLGISSICIGVISFLTCITFSLVGWAGLLLVLIGIVLAPIGISMTYCGVASKTHIKKIMSGSNQTLIQTEDSW